VEEQRFSTSKTAQNHGGLSGRLLDSVRAN
jgi:hypothetical protein